MQSPTCSSGSSSSSRLQRLVSSHPAPLLRISQVSTQLGQRAACMHRGGAHLWHPNLTIHNSPPAGIYCVGDNPGADVRGANQAGPPFVSVLVRTGRCAPGCHRGDGLSVKQMTRPGRGSHSTVQAPAFTSTPPPLCTPVWQGCSRAPATVPPTQPTSVCKMCWEQWRRACTEQGASSSTACAESPLTRFKEIRASLECPS